MAEEQRQITDLKKDVKSLRTYAWILIAVLFTFIGMNVFMAISDTLSKGD